MLPLLVVLLVSVLAVERLPPLLLHTMAVTTWTSSVSTLR
jgi:hypothetical protein